VYIIILRLDTDDKPSTPSIRHPPTTPHIREDMQKKVNEDVQLQKQAKIALKDQARHQHEANAAFTIKGPLNNHHIESKLRQPGKFGRDMHRHF